MKEQEKRHGTSTEFTEQVMVLVDKHNNKEQRRLRWFSKEVKEGEYRYLIVFDQPDAIQGTALLTWDHDEGESEQWIFLPAQKRMQRIAQGSKKGYFVGTDFTYEDLEPEDLDNFTFTVIREEDLDDSGCWVIEAVPANQTTAQQSGYKKRLLWVRKDIYLTMKIEFYNQQNILVKTQTNHEPVNIKESLWRCNKVLMSNQKTAHKTLMAVVTRKINEVLDNQIFTDRYILSGRHIQ
jgi:hypothetical protein